jgi:two-component system response regulator VicR
MPIFVRLHKLSDKGAGDILSINKNLREIERSPKGESVRILVTYATLGEYDAISLVEAPDIESISKIDETLKSGSAVSTTTMKGMTVDELEGLITNLVSIMGAARGKREIRGIEKKILENVEKEFGVKKAYDKIRPVLRDYARGQEETKGRSEPRRYIPKVLVVDDEPDFLILMESLLNKKGYNVTTASSGREALKKVEDEIPEIIILDIIMPDMTGWEVAKKIKSNPQTKDISIIMLSVIADEKNKWESLWDADADWHVSKPFDKDHLLSILETAKKRQENKVKEKKILTAIEVNKKIKKSQEIINPKILGHKYDFLKDLGV